VKIAHLTSAHPAADVRIAFRECGTLAAAGYDVVLIAAGGTSQPLPDGVVLRSVPKPRNRTERMTRTVWDVFKAALRENADVYHFHDPELAGVGLALRALGRKVVFDVHEDIPKDIVDKPWIPAPLRKPIALSAAVVLGMLQKAFSAIVAATPAIARRFDPSHTVVVSNYPRLEDLPLDAVDGALRTDAALYLGSITELRCLEEMVRAMAQPGIPENARLLLAGTFESEKLEQGVRTLPGWDRVTYLGQCSRAQVKQLLSKARVGLLLYRAAANHEECVPNKLFEYLGAGLPVIVADTMQCREIVEEERCGIVVDPLDVPAIAAAITWMIEHPAIAQQMGERGRRLVLERYQWSSEAKKLTNLYAQIA
jgi:glycosyltransferase involved in cell wall biosynthesis